MSADVSNATCGVVASYRYSAVEHRLRNGDWYTEFDMGGGRPKDFTFNSLQAFWPGLQTSKATIFCRNDHFAAMLSVGSINKVQRAYYQFNNPESQRKKGLLTD